MHNEEHQPSEDRSPADNQKRTSESVDELDMDYLTLDRLIAGTLVEDYDWDEERAEEAVAARRDSGSDSGWDVAAVADSIHRAHEDDD